jgi:hypothetical protein
MKQFDSSPAASHKRNPFGVYAKGGLGSRFHAQVRFKHVELEPTLMASGRAGVALHAEIPKSFSPYAATSRNACLHSKIVAPQT